MTTTDCRAVAKIVAPMAASDGAGVRLKRSIGSPALDHLDPFLLLDEFGSDDSADTDTNTPSTIDVTKSSSRRRLPRLSRQAILRVQESMSIAVTDQKGAAGLGLGAVSVAITKEGETIADNFREQRFRAIRFE